MSYALLRLCTTALLCPEQARVNVVRARRSTMHMHVNTLIEKALQNLQ